MNSPSLVVNSTPVVPPAGCADPAGSAAPGFDLAMAAAQADAQGRALPAEAIDPAAAAVTARSSALAMLTSMQMEAVVPEAAALASAAVAVDARAESDPDSLSDTPDPSDGSLASLLAQMLAGSVPPARTAETAVEQGESESALPQPALPPAKLAAPIADPDMTAASSSAEDGPRDSGQSPEDPIGAGAVATALLADKSTQPDLATLSGKAELPGPGATTPAAPSAAAQAVQSAASALRDAFAAPSPQAAVHATLREPVGTARWADELGNRLVLMSVRGQQQGSLTLTPEHLGPVEVQISVNRETANVWFSAPHADTRAALSDAMPRLRELLGASGLSLGQSGVSEQAPREGRATASADASAGLAAVEADTAALPAVPAWRIWRPGQIDTYA